ncbi:MAG: response regulator transcription factor [Atopobiaceae bacterium]|jgi:DNA-binding response OmpR family regulator|nr:response regulator transcription factor [Olegusella sp.]MCI1934489.1 response regulator transcription factor [Atopobiaceae bacterium]
MNILVVEDERSLADAICRILQDADFNTEAAYDGTSGLALAETGSYDAIVLDIMLPGKSGLDIVHDLRRQGNSVPVLLLTARTSTTDKVSGLDAGADDYMTKPFEPPELLARLRALTRRSGDVMLETATFGDLSLDLSTHDLSCGERTVHLSGKEFEVMRTLMASSARVLSKQDLLSRVWGSDADASENSVEAYVSFLRKKLSHLHSGVQITTLRMLGYRLESFDTAR